MRFTQSPETVVHPGTGNRLHTDTAPIPSAWTADDANMILWELNAIRIAAGIAPLPFNPDNSATFSQVLQALNQLFITPAELASYAPSATQTLQGLVELATSPEGIALADFTRAVTPGVLGAVLAAWTASNAQAIAGAATNVFVTPAALQAKLNSLVLGVPIGTPMYWPGTTAPPGFSKRNGGLFVRAEWPLLWTMAQASGNLVTEAEWPYRPGSFSTGDGATTFRIPMGLGLTERGYHDSNGAYDADTGSPMGQYRDSRNKIHSHFLYGDNSGSGPNGQVASLAGSGNGYPIAGSGRSGGYIFLGGAGQQLIANEGGADAYPRHVLYMPILRTH